jgi:hypothetical protein
MTTGRICGWKRDEMTGGCGKLHNEELHNLYSSPSIIGIMKARTRWAGRLARMDAMGKPEGKRPLGRPRCRCEDNINVDPREIGWRVMN